MKKKIGKHVKGICITHPRAFAMCPYQLPALHKLTLTVFRSIIKNNHACLVCCWMRNRWLSCPVTACSFIMDYSQILCNAALNACTFFWKKSDLNLFLFNFTDLWAKKNSVAEFLKGASKGDSADMKCNCHISHH